MHIYFLLIRLAALFGHRKAKLMIAGQREAFQRLKEVHFGSDGHKTIWFHAASVGEFEQARPIIERLHAEQPRIRILLTFFSPSGYELRKRYEKVDLVTYLPFATRRNVKKFMEVVHPDMAIFVKYEFWPAYLKRLHTSEIPTYIISAIFRPGQLFFRPWGKWYKRLLTYFKTIYVQDESSLLLLEKHGLTHVKIAGDTRFDRVSEIAAHAKAVPEVQLFVGECKQVIVAGSTWSQDEELLARYVAEHPDTRLVLVPHEIDRNHLHRIMHMFEGRYVRFTEATRLNIASCRVLLVDTVGMLSSVYQYGQVAYVGGGFGVGIHNTLEAAVWGMPVVFGPNFQHFREAKGLIAAGGGFTVSNYDEFEQAMDVCLSNFPVSGKAAGDYVRSELGATDTIYNDILK